MGGMPHSLRRYLAAVRQQTLGVLPEVAIAVTCKLRELQGRPSSLAARMAMPLREAEQRVPRHAHAALGTRETRRCELGNRGRRWQLHGQHRDVQVVASLSLPVSRDRRRFGTSCGESRDACSGAKCIRMAKGLVLSPAAAIVGSKAMRVQIATTVVRQQVHTTCELVEPRGCRYQPWRARSAPVTQRK